ncbi:MAG: hypothetical protein ACE5JG_08040 [Planctomycetota bacterium]
MSVSSREVLAELLGMGYGERDVSELQVRLVLRRLIALAREG